MNTKLYETFKHLEVNAVCEVGVYSLEASNVLGWIRGGVRAYLFEPDPELYLKIKEDVSGLNTRLWPHGIADKQTNQKFYRTQASGFSSRIAKPPAVVNRDYQPNEDDAFWAMVNPLSFYDIDFDVLSIDVEGGEYWVLKGMTQRPKVISVEMEFKDYRNPKYDLILGWMRQNNYNTQYRDGADFVFKRAA